MDAIAPPALSRDLGRHELITKYFFEGYEYSLIVCFLFFVHGISLSVRQLKRILRRMNLRRRGDTGSIRHRRTVRNLIQVSSSLTTVRSCVQMRVWYVEGTREFRKLTGIPGYVETITTKIQSCSVKFSLC